MDEAISKQKVIDKLDEALERITKNVSKESDAYHIVHGTVDVTKCMIMTIQPKRGRWHYSDGKPATIGLSFGVVCDQCGTESEYCTNFCGECGADMRVTE